MGYLIRLQREFKKMKDHLDLDILATFVRLYSDADALVCNRRYSFASTEAIQQCWVGRVVSA